MDIRLRRENHQIMLRLSQLLFEIHRKKNAKRYLWSSLLAIGFLGVGILEKVDFGSIWNVFTGIGMGFLFIIYIGIVQTIKMKKKAVGLIVQRIAKLVRVRSVLEISFTDSMIEYRDEEVHVRANWSNYPRYLPYKDCLFIFNDDDSLRALGIEKGELPAEAWQELEGFLAAKIPLLEV
jgi:hypothetical protein